MVLDLRLIKIGCRETINFFFATIPPSDRTAVQGLRAIALVAACLNAVARYAGFLAGLAAVACNHGLQNGASLPRANPGRDGILQLCTYTIISLVFC